MLSPAATASAQIRPAAITGAITNFRTVTKATDPQIINDIPNVTQNPVIYAMLRNGVQPRSQTSTNILGDL